MYDPNRALCIIRDIIIQHIYGISINFNVCVYGSRKIIFHKQIIINKFLCISKAFVNFTKG